MAAPSTTGMGQGAAQVFDTSGLAQQYGQAKVLDEQQKAAQKKEEEKRLAELLGAGDKLFNEKYYATRDGEDLQRRFNTEIIDWMKGREKNIIDPSHPDAQEYKKRIQNILFDMQTSEESKNLARPILQDMVLNSHEYEPESLQYAKEFANTPWMVFDNSKIKKVNKYDILKTFNDSLPEWEKTVEGQGSNDFYSKNKDVFGNYTTIKSNDDMENNHMTSFINRIKSDPQGEEQVYRIYGDEAAKRQANGEDVNVWDLVWQEYKPKLKRDITKANFSQVSGAGDEDVFNEENIQEVYINSGDGGVNGWFYQDVTTKPTKSIVYDTGKVVNAVIPFNSGTIDLTTGKPYKSSGTFPAQYGSPTVFWFNEDGSINNEGKGTPKVKVPGRISGDVEGKQNTPILQDFSVMKNLYKNGDQIEKALLDKARAKSTNTKKTTTTTTNKNTGGAY